MQLLKFIDPGLTLQEVPFSKRLRQILCQQITNDRRQRPMEELNVMLHPQQTEDQIRDQRGVEHAEELQIGHPYTNTAADARNQQNHEIPDDEGVPFGASVVMHIEMEFVLFAEQNEHNEHHIDRQQDRQ